jgi:16S rRNA (adenine1518-N6/adenine1519-N6)-dimethyltransferase
VTHGARPRARKRFGQHFLERAWANRLVDAIAPRSSDAFVEIGPGAGALTLPLAATGASIRAIELDRDQAAALAPRLPPNVELLRADFLALPAADILGAAPRVRIIGNLPYNLSSPILARLLDLARSTGRIIDATVMLQREVADRVLAEPGTRDNGPLAILIGLYADRTRLLALPPGAFRPAPKVHSAVVRLAFRQPSVTIADRVVFDRLVRVLFQQRRKTVANALRPLLANDARDAVTLVRQAGIDPSRRPETLRLEELAALADVVGGNGGDAGKGQQAAERA